LGRGQATLPNLQFSDSLSSRDSRLFYKSKI
jgi:hypothetical protein